jgi:hypothetical protein
MAQWVSGRLGISNWAASRWVKASHAIEKLPAVSAALTNGILCVDKVIELTRFATPDTELKLVKWARGVNPATIRRRADVANQPSIKDHEDAQNARFMRYWYDDLMLYFEGALPADDGAKVVKRINRLADQMARPPLGSHEDINCSREARRADALAAMAAAGIAKDADQDRATVVVHVDLESLVEGHGGGELEGGEVINSEVVSRLGCSGDVEWVISEGERHAVGIGKRSRKIPRWMERQLRYRDGGCVFPGCGANRFTEAHHIVPWPEGATELDNLTLLCSFHHKLVHEFKWKVALNKVGRAEWFRPGGQRYEPGPREDRAPPPSISV